MAKKLFGKRFVAILATLALLLSMVAMVGSFAVSAEGYTPKRTMSITAGGTQIEGKILMYQTAEALGANKDVVIKGYYKVDGYVAKNTTDHNVQIAPGTSGAASATANCDWTAFSTTWNTGAVGDYHVLKFGFWYAQGTMSLADIVIEDTEGNVLYDFASDATLPAGDITGAAQHGFWYFGFYGEQSEFSGHIDPAYENTFAPKRTMSITAGGTQIEGKILMYQTAEALGANKDVVIKGYYKVDGYVAKNTTDHNVQIAPGTSGAASATANTDWTAFSTTWNTGAVGDYHVLKFGFWYAQGTMTLADIVIEDTEGNVLYDFASDANLAAGDITGAAQHGFWYFGFYGEQSEFSGHIDPVYTYNPKRTMSITAGGTQIEGKILMYQTAEALGANKDVVIKGYYKVDGYVAKNTTDHNVQIAPGTSGAASATADCGWTAFSTTWNTGEVGAYHVLKFGFWYAQGTMTLADIVIEDTEGNVLYDFASDANLAAGDITGAAQHGFWYFGFYGEQSEFSGHIDPAYKGEYKPTRVLSATGVNSEVNAKIAFYSGSLGLTNGAKATIKGYYKVDDFKLLSAGNSIFIGTGTDARIAVTDNTDGWVEFELTFTVGAIIYFEHFYTQGTLSLADLVIEDTEGKKYELATDASLPESDHTGVYDDGKWYTGFYNKADDAIFHFDKAIGNEVPPAPPINAVETPEIPNLLEQDATGYGPNRAFGIINTKDEMPVANFAVWAEDYFVTSDKYYVFAHVKVSGFEAFEGAADAACQIEMLAGENPAQIIGSWNANTEGWVALVDENGNPISFEKLTMADSFVLNFSVKNAKANFIIGDLIIADAAGNIVYSLANDKMLNLESDMRYTTSTDWNATPYVANPDGPTLFPIQTKGNEAYVPNVGISIAPNPFHKTSETSIIIMTNAAPFVAGETYTIHGKMFVSIEGGFCGNANPKFDFTSHTLGPIGSASVLDTCGGWVSLVYPNGNPIVFKGTEGLDYVKFNLFNAYGALAVADIYITDSQGNVVYDMAKDEILLGQAGEFECEGFVDKGAIWRIVLNNYAVGEIYVNEAPVEHTAEDYTVPTFVETVTVPSEDDVPPTSGMSILLIAALGAMSATGAAALTLKKKAN